MKTNDELKDQVIANLSVENVTLKNKIKVAEEDNRRYGKYWMDEQKKVKELEAKLKALKSKLNKLNNIEVVVDITDEKAH